MKFVDTHCHLDDERFNEDREEVLKRIEEKMEFVVNVGFDLPSSKTSVEYSNTYPFIYSAIGVHPTSISEYNDEVEKELIELSKNKKVVAIGEIGLDYYWMEDEKEVQKEGFRKQMRLAEKLNLPVIIHSRDAMADTIEILNEFPNVRGIVHCYPGSFESAMNIPSNYYFGVGGVLTFKNSKKTVEFVNKIDISKLVIETDSPYLTPVPFRGKRNEPIYTEYVVKKISEIKNIPVEEVLRITTENAKKIYEII
ncbi:MULTISPECIES: TatD family hydrolase [Fusobacterium]|uniref:TatD family hydrolase n=1 Tax=Fusobacterium TaxID=848 RepID=UPI001F347ED8|nr:MULTISPECIES: TatD family hydrolase [Fusobacterium]MCF2613016.1 TatD family hydrolase [Fusobacterium perfoetens]MDY2980878.1 TatD family hydrolase [Fusobacterium sp.]